MSLTETLRIRRLLDGLVGDITMKHVDGLVSAVLAYGYCDPEALENVRLKLPLILDGLKNLPHGQRHQIMDSKDVMEFFFNILQGSGDREIQFLALSILLRTPTISKLGEWMAPFWFSSESVRLEFLKLLKIPQDDKVYYDFVDILNDGDDALVHSWKCSAVIQEEISSGSSSQSRVKTPLSFNLGTRTISFSLMGRDIRFPFSDVVCHEIEMEDVKGHEMLHLRIETDKSSYSFLGFQDETGASMFIRGGNLSKFLLMRNSSPQGNGEEEYFGIEPFHEMSFLQEVTLKHGDLELVECEPKSGNSCGVVELQHEDPEHFIKHEPKNGNSCEVVKFKHADPEPIKHEPKGSVICGVSDQSVPKRVYKFAKSRGVHSKKKGNSCVRKSTRKGMRRTTSKNSRLSLQKAVARLSSRRSSRHLDSSKDC